MNATPRILPRMDLATRVLASAALASWAAPLWCVRLRLGATALEYLILPALLGFAAVLIVIRLATQRHGSHAGIFFPSTGGVERGALPSIRLIAALLLAFNIGAAGFILRESLSHTTLVVVIALSSISAMNLADECWIAYRRRLAPLP